MEKPICSLRVELLLLGNEDIPHLTKNESWDYIGSIDLLSYLSSINRYSVYAAFKDFALIHRFEDVELSPVGLRMMVRHSWYLQVIL